jgi:methylmalonyl-CoA/ethylmalonyl-CoA epimerase
MVGEPAGAPEVPPRLHHVVFAVRRESFERASEYLGGLGFLLAEFVLDDVGLRVAIDWAGGVELLTPTDDHLAEPGSVGDFLARQGEGVFSVVVRVPDADQLSQIARAAGAAERYRQERRVGDFTVNEVEVTALFGIPLTFLETDLD